MDIGRDGIPGRQYAPLLPSESTHRRFLVEKLKAFKVDRGLSYAQIIKSAEEYASPEHKRLGGELISNEYLRQFVAKPENTNPGAEVMNALYRYLDDNNGWDQRSARRNEVQRIPDAIFFTLLNFFDVAEKSTTNLMRRLPGIYRIYRPLLTHPGYFVVGVVLILPDERESILIFREHSALQALNGREAKKVDLEGYAFKKSNFVILFATDTAKSSIHATVFTSCEIEDDKYIVLFGGFLDTLGRQMYSGQVFMERVSGVEPTLETFHRLSKESCCLSIEEIPPSIAQFFDSGAKTERLVLF